MLRFRFGSGVILGLVLGLPAGALIAILVSPARPAGEAEVLARQVRELERRLESATDARRRADQQFEQFQKLSEQMTASFNNLERRFTALQEEHRLLETRATIAAAVPTATPPRPTPPAPPPTATIAAPPPAPEVDGDTAPEPAESPD